jgi:cytochrome P450
MSKPNPTSTECPVVPYTFYAPSAPALTFFTVMDGHQDAGRPAVRSDESPGYLIFTDRDTILDGLQQPDLWSSTALDPTEPDPPYKMIPIQLDPPEHTRWRHVLASYFSPGRVRSMLDSQHRMAAELVEVLRPAGRCDFVRDLASVFPSRVFLEIMGMPEDKLAEFMQWEDGVLHRDIENDPDGSRRNAAMGEIITYFMGLIAERRANPDRDAQDVVTAAIGWQVDGQPADDTDILNCLLFLFMAGLDTVASQSSYMWLHLATHAEHRLRIVSDPAVIPSAAEELMRAYPIIQTSRKAIRDAQFHGCPVKKGDMALFPLAAAGRDEQAYPHARSVDFDRGVIRHLTFGAGPHRCLGSHLARQELTVLLEEWHRLIPDYELVELPNEHSAGVWGLESLPLQWKV